MRKFYYNIALNKYNYFNIAESGKTIKEALNGL